MSLSAGRGRGATLPWALLIATVVGSTGCGGADDGAVPIPTRPESPPASAPVVTEPNGSPGVAEFVAPETFVCLAEDPRQVQVLIGWEVPTATDVEVELDGVPVPSGISKQLPFEVPAGPASGIGSTIVFDCDERAERTITISWSFDGSPPTQQVVEIVREADDA